MASRLLLCVLLCSCYSIVHGGDEYSVVVVPSNSLEPPAVCSTATVNAKLQPNRAAVSLPLAHRHGPCVTPSADKPSSTEILRRNRGPMNHIASRVARSTSTQGHWSVSIPSYLGSYLDSLDYVVTVGLGTPAVEQTMLIDTGSDLSWVQCAPCNATSCYPQKDPLFDPSHSSTYSPIPCSSDACRNLAADDYDNGCAANGTLCGFGISYGDGSGTRGVYSSEMLTLAPEVTVESFRFGCGHDQDGPNDRYDGLLGLGGAPESLVAQTSSSAHGGAFSYCLPAVSSKPGFLALGGAPSNSTPSGFAFTPMGTVPRQATFYTVMLAGIAIDGKHLDLPPSAFAGRMIVDSGAIPTGLQSTAYKALRSAFRKAMEAYPLVPNDQLDSCYNLTGHKNVTVPSVALSFSGGATIYLDIPDGILVDGCLAFVESGPDGGIGFLGNVNQRTFEVLFETRRRRVGFRANAC